MRISTVLRAVHHLKAQRIVETFSVVEPKLEDVYIRVTRDEVSEANNGAVPMI